VLGPSFDTIWKKAFKENIIPSATMLTANTWSSDGFYSDGDYWYKFTATARTQYIHGGYFMVYDSSGSIVEITHFFGDESSSLTVTVGQKYYIRTWGNRIAFNTTIYPPGTIQLTTNTWADCNFTGSGYDDQWFKFTSTASEQFIHASFGTLSSLYIEVYDSSGDEVKRGYLYSYSYALLSVTSGQTYYISVSSSYSGTCQIAFNAFSTPPLITLPATTIQLTANTWANGNITTSGSDQWFKFIANINTQYIHVSFGTLYDLSVQVYDSSGGTVESETVLDSYNSYTSRSVTSGQTYYIRVRPYYSSGGTYRISFNTSSTPPP